MSGTKGYEVQADSLKTTLKETLDQVKAGKMDIELAKAISCSVREIARVTKLQLQIAMLNNSKPGESLLAFAGDKQPKAETPAVAAPTTAKVETKTETTKKKGKK